MPGNRSAADVDGRRLAHRHVLGLHLRDPQLRLEHPGLHHHRLRLPGLDPLAGLEVQLLQHAVRAGGHVQGCQALLLEIHDLLQSIHLGLLYGQLLLRVSIQERQPLPLDLKTLLQLFHLVPGPLQLVLRDQVLRRQLFVGPQRANRLLVRRAGLRDDAGLVQSLGLQTGPHLHQTRLGRRQLALRLQRLELHVRVRHLHDHRPGLDLRARLHQPPLHPARRHRRDAPYVLRDQCAGAPDLTNHGTALDLAREGDVPVHRRRRRLQPGQPPRGGSHQDHDQTDHDPPLPLPPRVLPGHVHHDPTGGSLRALRPG